MTENSLQITVENIKKMLTESVFSDETKKAYLNVLGQMTEEEKRELMKIMEEGSKAKSDYEIQKSERLAKLNAALEKHLKETARNQNKYARDQFENLGKEEDGSLIQLLEEEIKTI